MLKIIARLESVVGSRVGHFLLEHDTPVPVAKAMCDQFLNYLQSLEDKSKADEQAKASSQPIPDNSDKIEQPKPTE